ncbi:MAG: FAD-dependent oxidoreductase [Candidatus Heteroscillospira sp.]
MDYLWSTGLEAPFFPPLQGDERCDVLVIGGGMAGVLCALELKKRNIDCILAEAETPGSGVTRGTTAVLSAQHDTLYTKLISDFGREKAGLYLRANLDAIERFEALSSQFPCDFQYKDSYMYTRSAPRALEAEARTVRDLGFPAEFVRSTNLPFPVAGAVRYPDMAQFHPLKLLYQAARELKIYSHTQVTRISGGVAETTGGRIRAKKYVVATHFPFINSHGMYFMKMYQSRSCVLALENAPELDGTYTCTEESDLYFRNWENLLLIGGGDRRTGTAKGGFAPVREAARKYFPEAKERFAWAAQDCMSLDGVPYIGRYSPGTPEIFVATGFNEWGMTSSMAASMILADLIEGRENRFAPVFDPQRGMMKAQLLYNTWETAADFVIPTPRRCSHLGCALRWNSEEQTWDCPCHGSRFTSDGTLLDGPAQRDALV